jgi:hypothetical protein
LDRNVFRQAGGIAQGRILGHDSGLQHPFGFLLGGDSSAGWEREVQL